MVDFKKRLGKKFVEKPLRPFDIYARLDRASDKGPLRLAQEAVLDDWYGSQREERDVIVKLHTGQGKTLIGLLMLQSKLNEGNGPALYLCPNNFLVQQTALQASQFGLHCVMADPDLPGEFLDGQAILIASIQKLFNGMTKFGLGSQSIPVETIVMDDAHACIDSIRDACAIRLPQTHKCYKDLLALFGPELEKQGVGTYADIMQHRYSALLPVPYWEWMDRYTDVAHMLAKRSDDEELRFVWPLLKDMLRDCCCIISGTGLEIVPYLPPLDLFGSYEKASSRIFMSATVTNDAFLIKGLRLSAKVVSNPLVYATEEWSGEKMVLIPSLMDPNLDRSRIVKGLAKPGRKRKWGVVALTPSFARSKDWKAYGATVADTNNIYQHIEDLKAGDLDCTLVIANRYDGIDLPDDSCRVLILDSKPQSETLFDRYLESCRSDSEVTAVKTTRIVEQGLGRSVRGEKDYCVIILIGSDLIKYFRGRESLFHFSPQTRMQIQIGLDIAEYAKEDIADGTLVSDALKGVINQCLKRDESWKEYYIERMNELNSSNVDSPMLEIFASEMAAETKYQQGNYDEAAAVIQDLVDKFQLSEKGWYIQEMARYVYPRSKSDSEKYQLDAHKANRFLLKPKHGVRIVKASLKGQKRIENILDWLRDFENFEELLITVDDMLGRLRFLVKAEAFEGAFNELGKALGFDVQRPDKEWKEGPDNLWALRDDQYLLGACAVGRFATWRISRDGD